MCLVLQSLLFMYWTKQLQGIYTSLKLKHFKTLIFQFLFGTYGFSGIKDKEVGDEKLVAVFDLANITYKNLDARGLITSFQFLQVSISFSFLSLKKL